MVRSMKRRVQPPLNARGWRMDGVIAPDRRRTGQEPLRQSVQYTAAEDRDLLAQHEAGARIEDIAAWHQRGINGVSTRLERLGAWSTS
jgi:hypothetical protein